MNDFVLKLEGDELQNAKLELLISILATQEAMVSLFMSKIYNDVNDRKDALEVFVKKVLSHREAIILQLHTDHGAINLNDLIT